MADQKAIEAVRIVDPTVPTRQLAVDSTGAIAVNQGLSNGGASPWAVSGTVLLGASPNVGQTAGPWAVSGNIIISGGSIKTDKTAFVEGTSTFTPVGGVVNDTLAGDVAEDTNAAVRITPRRALHVNLRDSSATEIGTPAVPLAVSGTVSVNTHAVFQTAGPWTVSGTVTVGNSPNVGQTAGPWTVSGTVTVGNSPNVGQTAGPWAVSGTVAATQSGTWNVGQTAGPWAVSGTVTASLAIPQPLAVSGSLLPPQNSFLPSGTITVSGQAITLATNGCSTAFVNVSGTWTGQLRFFGRLKNSDWVGVYVAQLNVGGVGVDWTIGNSTAFNGLYQLPCAAYSQVMVQAPSGVAFSGTAQLQLEASEGVGSVYIAERLPTGTNHLGSVTVDTLLNVGQTAGPWAVSGTVAATQSGAWNVGQTAGPWAVSGTVTTSVAIPQPLAVSGNVSQTAGPWAVSGAVTVANSPNVGQTAGPWAVSGTVSAIITGGSTKTDKSGYTEGTSSFTPVGGVVNDTLAGDVTEDTNAAFRMTPKRALHVNLRDSSAIEIGTPTVPLAVSGTVSALQSGAWNVGQTAGPWAVSGTVATTAASGGFTAYSVRNDAHNDNNLADDGQRQPLQSDSEGSVLVSDNRLRRALNQLLPALAVNMLRGAEKRWSEVRVWTVLHGADPPLAGAGRSVRAIANGHGIPFTIGGHPNTKCVRANYTAAQTNTVLVANSYGSRLIVTRITFTLDKATTPNVSVVAGLAASVTPTTTNVVAAHPGIDPGGGLVTGDGSGILASGLDGDQLLVTCAVPTAGSLDVVATYYVLPA